MISRILQTAGLFVVIVNVFVMKPRTKNCPSCRVNTNAGIVLAGLFLLYYCLELLFFTYVDFTRAAKH